MSRKAIRNQLLFARRQRGLSRKQVAAILGYDDTSTIARQEQGKIMPPLQTLLGLEILYRTPVAYLYPQLYKELRDEIRAKEAALTRTPTEAESQSEEKGASEHAEG